MNTLTCSLLSITLGITLTAGKCTKSQVDLAKEIGSGPWELSQLAGKAITMPEGYSQPNLEVDAAKGTVSGFAGCNRFNGAFKLEGERATVSELGSTKKFCEGTMDVENAFTKALRDMDSMKLQGGKLSLLKAGQELATLVRKK